MKNRIANGQQPARTPTADEIKVRVGSAEISLTDLRAILADTQLELAAAKRHIAALRDERARLLEVNAALNRTLEEAQPVEATEESN